MKEGRPRVYVVGGDIEYAKPFGEILSVTLDAGEADVVLFTGGADVSPDLYGEENVFSACDPERDRNEVVWWKYALKRKLPTIGICRGSQFLTVMNGGKLYQDVGGHAIYNTHDIQVESKAFCGKLPITSTHHQMMRPAGNFKLIGWTKHLSKTYRTAKNMFNDTPELEVDPEIVFYPDTKSLCIQGHPEHMAVNCETNRYLRSLVEELLL